MALRDPGAPFRTAEGVALRLLDELFGELQFRDFRVRLWDGTVWVPPGASSAVAPKFTIVLKRPSALRNMFSQPSDLTLGEAFICDDFDVDGDIIAVFVLAAEMFDRHFGILRSLRLRQLLDELPSWSRANRREPPRPTGPKHSRSRDREAVTYHYNVSNDFYRLWLDRRMVYSCAYFPSGEEDLDRAQERKLDYLCRKLRLQNGELLLDLGCGWGGLIVHAARHYDVRALGITLSQPQADVANARIREAGLADRCRAEVRDYRDLDEKEAFDKIVSVGMFEHVGESKLAEYFRRAWTLLRPGGAFVNHGIAESMHKPDRGLSFVKKYVFPDGELVPIATTIRTAEEAGWEIRDLESLREHYARTLQIWVRRLEEHGEDARRLVGEVAYRIWRLYLAGAAYRFRTGWLNLYQVLMVKPDHGRSGLPYSRADWYQNELADDHG